MNRGIVLFATDDESIIRDVEEKIEASKNESTLIKNTSKEIFGHLFKIIEKNMSEDEKSQYEFEREFCRVYDSSISAKVEELNANRILEEILIFVTSYNKNFEIEKQILWTDDYKIKINPTIFDSFLKYIFRFCINPDDSYIMRINSDMNYVVNKEIANLIVSIVDKTNEKSMTSSYINKLSPERVEFINSFMNQLLEPCNCKFRINKVDAKLTAELHLIREIGKK